MLNGRSENTETDGGDNIDLVRANFAGKRRTTSITSWEGIFSSRT